MRSKRNETAKGRRIQSDACDCTKAAVAVTIFIIGVGRVGCLSINGAFEMADISKETA